MYKKFRWGSLSFVVFLIGILFPITLARTFCLGDLILDAMGVPLHTSLGPGLFRSNIRTSVLLSIIFLIAGCILGWKFRDDVFAKNGRILCTSLLIFMVLNLVFTLTLG